MEIRYGSAIVKQIALGPLSFYRRPCPQVPEHSLLTPEEELIRFSRARQTALDRLERLREQAVELLLQKPIPVMGGNQNFNAHVSSFSSPPVDRREIPCSAPRRGPRTSPAPPAFPGAIVPG